MNLPAWLTSPAINELLHHLVDKLDKRPDNTIGLIKLDQKLFPELFKAEFEAEKELYWSQLKQMEAWGWLRVKTDRQQAGKADYELRPRLEILDGTALRQVIGRSIPYKSALQHWREAVFAGLEADDDVKTHIASQKLEVSGQSAQDIVARLNLLTHYKDETFLLREISAKLFWGQSKILDKRQSLIASLLQVEDCPFPESPIQLHVFLPAAEFSAVLFIENLVTFERAIQDQSGRFHDMALIYAAGFKGAARRLRSAGGASIYFASSGNLAETSRKRFLNWLIENRVNLTVWFWGDLDYAGMQILKSLRYSFHNIEAWQPGYQPMLDALLRGEGHSPEDAKKAKQKPLQSTGSNYADQQLLPALVQMQKFLDQEF